LRQFQDMMMGVEPPIPPFLMNAAAPDGAPPRRINDGMKNPRAPPCLGEALRRGALIHQFGLTKGNFHIFKKKILC